MTEFRKEETCVCCGGEGCRKCNCDELEEEINEEKETGIVE